MTNATLSKGAKSRTKGSPKKTPKKPRKDFPLWFHRGSGQWCKKIRGKSHYFGTDAEAAEKLWDLEKHDLLAGRIPATERAAEDLTVKWLCDSFMNSRVARMKAGKIRSQETINDYHAVVKRFASEVGRDLPLSKVRPTLLEHYAHDLPQTWGVVTRNNHLRLLRSVLKWANDSDELARPIKYERALEFYTERQVDEAARHDSQLSINEVHKLIATAERKRKWALKAAIFLGVNAGYTTSDLAALRSDHLDLEHGWASMPRTKNGNARLAWLWPETIGALCEAIEHRPRPSRRDLASLVFLTRDGRPVQTDGSKNRPMTAAFRRLKIDAKVHRPNVSQRSCRHLCRTLADSAVDANAARRIMGHVIPGIERNYIDRIDRDRIKRVCEHIRDAFYEELSGPSPGLPSVDK